VPDLRHLLVCPACHGTLVWGAEASCAACPSSYRIEAGIPVLLAEPAEGVKAGQAAWFDEEVDAEYEIERPAGTPAFHRWLLGEKFRRSVEAIRPGLGGASALCVCAGSGMDAEFLAHAGARVISADISLGAALRAKERARRHGLELVPIVADAERLPFADRSVDLVYVHDGLHHLEQPVAGLGEMARVARRAVSVTEPARAAVTRLSVLAGISGDVEEAGNRVERVVPAELEAELRRRGFDVVRRQRYAMFYRHQPGRSSRVLSLPGLFQAARLTFVGANVIVGQFGNKLALQAVRGR